MIICVENIRFHMKKINQIQQSDRIEINTENSFEFAYISLTIRASHGEIQGQFYIS